MRTRGFIEVVVLLGVLIIAAGTFIILKTQSGMNLLQLSQKMQLNQQTKNQSSVGKGSTIKPIVQEKLTVTPTPDPFGFSIPSLPTNLEWKIVTKGEERSDFPDLVWHAKNWEREGDIELPGTERLAIINIISELEGSELEKRGITTFESDYRMELLKRGWDGSCPSFYIYDYIFCTIGGGGVGLSINGFYKKIGDKIQIVNVSQGLPSASRQGDVSIYPHKIEFRIFISEVMSEEELLKLIP